MLIQRIRKLVYGKSRPGQLPALELHRFNDLKSYLDFVQSSQVRLQDQFHFEKSLLPATPSKFQYTGHCHVCNANVNFTVDYAFAFDVNGSLMPNWREWLVCPICKLNNRMRAVMHVFASETGLGNNATVYLTEQTTALYKLFRKTFPNTTGSEFLGDAVDPGTCNANGIRNEDVTSLSFADDSFDAILSFDVFEHVPGYRKALEQCYRCIKPGGYLLFSVPFIPENQQHQQRAKLSDTGEIIHLLPAEYHGDPINAEGCLCFYKFGWDLMDELKAIGFQNPQALLYWSKEYAYLGHEQMLFVARV